MMTYIKRHYGFTLIELLIAIAIMAILASIVIANLASSSKQGRDAKRQADLTIMKAAIEQYRARWGRYPAMGCTGPADTNGNEFSDEGDDNCDNYVTGATINGTVQHFVPNFISSLPRDPARNGNPGYAYAVNASGTVYKLMAYNTVESEMVTYDHPMKSCDIIPDPNNGEYPGAGINSTNMNSFGWCAFVDWRGIFPVEARPHPPSATAYPGWCKTSVTSGADFSTGGTNGGTRFDRSYAVWGGYAEETATSSKPILLGKTTAIICL